VGTTALRATRYGQVREIAGNLLGLQSHLSHSSVTAQSQLQSQHSRSWFFTQNMKGWVSTKTHVMNKEIKIFSGDTICVGKISRD